MHGPGVSLTGRTSAARGSEPITLRHPKWADFDDWVRLRRLSETELRRWEPDWNEAHFHRRAYKARLAAYRKLAVAGTAYPFHVIRDDGMLLGAVNLSDIRERVARSAQIGYWTGTPYARRGYALAAVRAAERFAFGSLGLHRLEAAVQDANAASVALLEKAGFQPEGVARGYLRIEGEWADHRIWAKLSSD